MIFRLITVHENSACRAGACPGLADASVGPTICAAVIFMAARNRALILFSGRSLAGMPCGRMRMSADFMIIRLTTLHENSARRAGACPGLADQASALQSVPLSF